ncbi:MAG: hypothetical protein VR74_17455 [Hyphomonas sp. BRH_c22]|uniref:glycosyltransferase family 4 protein n=1 Tax=Hyphomonas sp. BRH_c22 TaxID=1629710 RepID=UPI00061F4302|nr:glycosyltransferase family 4 protein [Hyphomonas sp. BRH_c22]KJS35150.1 MAG: hypothetical protein VR74_17455 [Hyphomonas sp. BRH_c22]
MTPDKIVIINDSSVALGGAAALALLSAKLFHEAGMKVVYVTGDDAADAKLDNGIDIEPLGSAALLKQPMPGRIANGLYHISAANFIRAIIARHDTPATVYHLHSWAQTFSPAIFAALGPVADRLVISSHDFSLVCPNGSYFNFKTNEVCNLTPLSPACLASNCDKRSRADKAYRVSRSVLLRRLVDFGKSRALVAAIHPGMAPWLARGGVAPERIRIVPNPVIPFRGERVQAERNSDLFFIGRVEVEKGVDLAARAAHAAGRRLRVIGDGASRPALAAEFPAIKWEGWRTHSDIADLISEARGLIMPSRLPEPFGLVALEALQSGVPLISFDDAFVGRQAAARGAAFLASRRIPEELANAVVQLDNDTVVRAASEAAFDQCRSLSLTPEQWRDALLDLYKEQLHAFA